MLNLGIDLLNLIYPIGSIYMSVNSTNPSAIFGGEWQKIAKGRTLVGVDEAQTEFNTVRKIGGDKSHRHLSPIRWSNQNPNVMGVTNGQGTVTGLSDTIFGPNSVTSRTDTNLIGYYTNYGSNLSPFFTCYMWERIA